MGPDRRTNFRNAAIVVLLTVVVWKLPGGGTGAATISNLLSVAFVGGLFFLAYRTYMERRDVIFGLEDRQRGLLYGALALLGFTLVATRRMWDAGPFGSMIWLALLSAAGWALYSVWRAYKTY